MTIYEKLKNKNIDELVEWFDEYCTFDTAPWWRWWDENYCDKCKPIKLEYPNIFGYDTECAYCELNDNCRFFKEMKDIPDNKQIIKMWLKSEKQ